VHCGAPFEDWWIHPSIIPASLWPILNSLDLQDKEYTEIIQSLQKVL